MQGTGEDRNRLNKCCFQKPFLREQLSTHGWYSGEDLRSRTLARRLPFYNYHYKPLSLFTSRWYKFQQDFLDLLDWMQSTKNLWFHGCLLISAFALLHIEAHRLSHLVEFLTQLWSKQNGGGLKWTTYVAQVRRRQVPSQYKVLLMSTNDKSVSRFPSTAFMSSSAYLRCGYTNIVLYPLTW